MFEYFENYITSKEAFTKEDLKLIRSFAIDRKLRKRQLLLHEGEVCKHKTFVAKGLLRMYRLKDDGTENILRFASEDWWIIDGESYNNQQPSRFNIEAVEETEVIQWTREHMQEIFEKVPAFKRYSERLKENTLDQSQNRVLMNIGNTAEEKYQDFIDTFPNVFNRVPLHMVASYLGVSRETLSRIRSTQLKRTS